MGSILVENLGKSYKTFHSCWGRFASWFGLNYGVVSEHWVLRNLSFKLNPGEAVGIVGKNGAGKSTLLKLITGTTKQSEGYIKMSGRVSALLELGMGFHPDLTGRQNAYLSATLLGLTQSEITNLMPSIEDFAEIGDYIDQPVRVYSSGMQARLAFSVATAVRPDILIVDEVLSVGDAYFQHKSFDRIRQYRQLGTTLLIVSHDKNAIQSICDRAILISEGRIVIEGETEAVMDYYITQLTNNKPQSVKQVSGPHGRVQTFSGNGMASFLDVTLYNKEGTPVALFYVGELVCLKINIMINKEISSLVLGCGIKDRLGQMMFGTNTHHTKQVLNSPRVGAVYTFDVCFYANLGVGSYSVHLSLVRELSNLDANFDWRENVCIFEVYNRDKYEFVGSQWNEMQFNISEKN